MLSHLVLSARLGQVNYESSQLWVGGCCPVLGSRDESDERDTLHGLHEPVPSPHKLKVTRNQRKGNSDHKL